MSADEIRLRIASFFDPKGVNDARRSMGDLARAASVAGSGIGGVFGKLGQTISAIFTGGPWLIVASAIVTVFTYLRDQHRKMAEEIEKRNRRIFDSLMEGSRAAVSAAREYYAFVKSSIDTSLAMRDKEADAVKNLAKAEVELARQKAIAAGMDKDAANAAANDRLADIDFNAAEEKLKRELDANERRVKAAEDAERKISAAMETAERGRLALDEEYARKRAEYVKSNSKAAGEHIVAGSGGITGTAVMTYSVSEKEAEASREAAAKEFVETDEAREIDRRRKELEGQIAAQRKEAQSARTDTEKARSAIETVRTQMAAVETRREARGFEVRNEIAEKVKSDEEAAKKEAEARAKEAERLARDEERETMRRIEAEKREREGIEREIAQRRLADLRDELALRRQEESEAQSRQSAAQGSLSQAWRWYRDKSQMQAQIDEHKAQAAAEIQWQKDFDRLKTWRSDWRTAEFGSLSAADEAVRQVAFAKEEKAAADRAVLETAENTRGLAEKIDELLAIKGGQ